jgi:hypothetical protein
MAGRPCPRGTAFTGWKGVAVGEAVVEERHQLGQLLGEVLPVAGGHRAPQHPGRHLVGARRPPEAEVDAAGVERFEHPELLGHDERRVVREHDPTRTQPDVLGGAAEVGEQHRR